MLKKILSDLKRFFDDEHILIYQMGKVGSTSLEESISKSIHLHRLYNADHEYFFYSPRAKSPFLKFLGNNFDRLRRIAIKQRKKIKIITLVRDLYGRNVSAFFQNFAFWLVEYSGKIDEDLRREDVSFVYEVFENIFDHNYPLTWFDKELKRLTGIDIFDHPFDKEKGWSFIAQGNYEILLIKLEKLSNAIPAIEAFANVKMELKSSNISNEKWYGSVYKNFKNNYVPSAAYIDMLYNSKPMRHFYSADEIEQLKRMALKLNTGS